jgi:alkanesulfonate monooxygenase SsuD/methylene tetrahydromethanopterin reductase-like flavin-dependent oxidoreductase (luciferase family)
VIDVGVGLWTMRSTAARPSGFPLLYRRLAEDARAAERLGFHSLWLAEHHFWYDGWCPAPVTAAAVVLGATTTLRAGTGIHLLGLWDLDTARSSIETAMRLSGGRLEIGVGLGYRDEEYDGLGLARRRRGQLMDDALDALMSRWTPAGGAPPVMVGGFSDAALRRAARRGLGIFLPFSLPLDKLRLTIERYREALDAAGQAAGRIGMLKYAWATDGSARERDAARAVIAASAREYSGAWFPLQGRVGFQAPELLDRQLRMAADNAFIGRPGQIAEQVAELDQAGVDVVVLQMTRDDVAVDHIGAMEAIAERVLAGFVAP